MTQGSSSRKGSKQQSSDTGFKIFYTESDRPVFINPKTGEFILTCAGFGPITMELSHVYAVFTEGAGSTAHGIKAQLYDGNGHRIRIVFDLTDPWICSQMSEQGFGWLIGPGCKAQTHHPKDPNDKSYIIEMGFCPKHLQEMVSKHGPIIPTSRDLTPPSKEVSLDIPDIQTAQSLLAMVSALNPNNQHPHPMFYDQPPPRKKASGKTKNGKPTSKKGKKSDDMPKLEKVDDEVAAWHDVE